VEDFDEKKKKGAFSKTLLNPSAYSSDKHYRHLIQVILSIADHGRAVIIGRGANFITDKDNHFHVRVTASLEHRIKRYANKNSVSLNEAKKVVESVDRERAEYVSHHFKADVDDPHHYHLVVNVEHLTNEQVARIIVSALGIKLGSPVPDNTNWGSGNS
jgi:cytidylate kinase